MSSIVIYFPPADRKMIREFFFFSKLAKDETGL